MNWILNLEKDFGISGTNESWFNIILAFLGISFIGMYPCVLIYLSAGIVIFGPYARFKSFEWEIVCWRAREEIALLALR